jgi:hypothetical protein
MASLLSPQIAEWMVEVDAALVELCLFRGTTRAGLSDEVAAVVSEVSSYAACALDDVKAMNEARALLVQRVLPQLDEAGHAALATAVEMLATVDFATSLDHLATGVRDLRRLRAALAVN